jgi:hypothetical protein
VLIHNLWDYAFTLELRDHTDRVQYSAHQNRVFNSSDPSISPEISTSGLSSLPDALRIGRRVLVHCPYSTLITQSLGLEPFCAETTGTAAILPGPFETIELGDFETGGFSESVVTVAFNNLTVSPRDFVTPPQLYWVSWGISDRLGLVVSGGIFTGIGTVFTVAAVVYVLINV